MTSALRVEMTNIFKAAPRRSQRGAPSPACRDVNALDLLSQSRIIFEPAGMR